MVVRVARQAHRSGARLTVVAADDLRIVDACTAHGVHAILTRNDHPSGSDRLAEACAVLGLPDEELVVNVQGDEPLMNPALINEVAHLLASVDRFGRVGGRLSDDGIRDVLLRIARRGLRMLQPEVSDADIEDQCRGLSGHSLRVGFAQDLTAADQALRHSRPAR